MGQYWYPVNLDKQEFIHPHRLGTGLKLWEQLVNGPGTGGALIVLCAAEPEMRGGGDFTLYDEKDEELDPILTRTIGRWTGDRIALVGDYAADGDMGIEDAASIYERCLHKGDTDDDGNLIEFKEGHHFRDITDDVRYVFERQLGGKFEGSGWCHFVRD